MDDLGRGAYVKLMSAVYASTYLIRVSFGIVLVSFAWYVDVRDFAYGLIVALAPLLELITVVYAGVWVERHGRRRILLAGLLIAAISNAGIALSTNVPVVAFVKGLHGVAAALIIIPSLAILSDATPAHARGREMGTFNFVNVFGWVSGFAIGYALLDLLHDVRWTFITAGSLALAGFLYARYAITDEKRTAGEHGHDVNLRDLRVVAKNRSVALTVAPFFVVFFLLGGFVFLSPKGTAGAEGFNALAFGGKVLLMGVVFLASQVVFGKLSDRYGRNPFLFAGAAGLILLTFAVLLGAAGNPRGLFTDLGASVAPYWYFVIPGFLGILAYGPAALASLADVAQKHPKGITMSLFSLVMSLGLILGSALMGLSVDLLGWGTGLAVVLSCASILFTGLIVARYLYAREDEARYEALRTVAPRAP